MRAFKRVFVMAAAVLIGLAGLPAQAQAAGYPSTEFWAYGSGGEASGGLVWYNRDVGVKGSVNDYADGWGSTVAHFTFWQGSGSTLVLIGTETRSVSDGQRSFNWTQPAPSGGITEVWVRVCNQGAACGNTTYWTRP